VSDAPAANSPRRQAEDWHRAALDAFGRGDCRTAVELMSKAIAAAPSVPGLHSDLGQILRAGGDTEAARASLERALALDPDHGKALANLASLSRAEGDVTIALDLARRAVAVAPDDPETHNNLGNALRDNGLMTEAIAAFDNALALDPEFALAHWNRALALLTAGDLEAGFAEMAWRWRWDGFPGKRRTFDQPLWDGADLGGGTLLLHAEQGLGDAIQFARYASLAATRASRVVLELPAALVPLAVGLADEVVAAGAPLPKFDAHAPLLDLPRVFATTLETVPVGVPYLTVPDDMRADLDSVPGLKVGLNWRGNPASPIERFRALPADRLAPWAAIEGVSWITLDENPADTAVTPPLTLTDVGTTPLVRAAAVIAACDLVITSDTAIAHLAGALAVPTFLALHGAADWRWLLNRADSPWYPTLTLFRQPAPGDWDPVIAGIGEALRQRAHQLL
jgi:Flp pilus assembly protein TadD